jgi:hypothetical protein
VFLHEVVVFSRSHGTKVEHVLTGNGARFKRRWGRSP